MIKVEDHLDTTLIYSKNNCQQCKRTKLELDKKGVPYQEVNIEEDNDTSFDDYVTYLKDGHDGAMAMPVVVPDARFGLDRWAGLQPGKIKALVDAVVKEK